METQAVDVDLAWAAPSGSEGEDSEEDPGPPVAFLVASSRGDGGSGSSGGGGVEHPLYAGDNFVGRGGSRDVTLADGTVSDSHALLTVSGDEVLVKDLKSR
jgi:hypothetical protein